LIEKGGPEGQKWNHLDPIEMTTVLGRKRDSVKKKTCVSIVFQESAGKKSQKKTHSFMIGGSH